MRKTQTVNHGEVLITLLGKPEQVLEEIQQIWKLFPPEIWGTWIREDTPIESTGDRFVIITRKEYI